GLVRVAGCHLPAEYARMRSANQSVKEERAGAAAWTPPTEAQRHYDFWELPDRRRVMTLAVLAAVLMIVIATVILPRDSVIARIFLDRNSEHFPYPFTIQNLLHVGFFIGLGELFVRWRVGVREMGFLKKGFLPEDDETVLQASDLGPIRKRAAADVD